jgi:uncharacterized protein (TIGR03067 family)
MRSSLLALLACGLWLAVGMFAPGRGDRDDDAKRIQGTWVVDPATFAEVKDERTRKEALERSKSVRIIFEGDTFTMKHPPGNEETGPFRLDPTKKPKQIDFTDQAKGIYELKADMLKLCWDQQGKANGRPTTFSLRQPKETVHYLVLRREKK